VTVSAEAVAFSPMVFADQTTLDGSAPTASE
jgi:hypothetical protein